MPPLRACKKACGSLWKLAHNLDNRIALRESVVLMPFLGPCKIITPILVFRKLLVTHCKTLHFIMMTTKGPSCKRGGIEAIEFAMQQQSGNRIIRRNGAETHGLLEKSVIEAFCPYCHRTECNVSRLVGTRMELLPCLELKGHSILFESIVNDLKHPVGRHLGNHIGNREDTCTPLLLSCGFVWFEVVSPLVPAPAQPLYFGHPVARHGPLELNFQRRSLSSFRSCML